MGADSSISNSLIPQLPIQYPTSLHLLLDIRSSKSNSLFHCGAKVASVLSTQKAIVPQATTKAKPSLNNQNRLLTNVTPFKQPLNTPNPQEVVVVNQNNGNIGQNVSDRFLAHALTGGIGMGKLDV